MRLQSRVHACGEGRTVPNRRTCLPKAEEILLFWSFLVIQQPLSAIENETKRLEKLPSYFPIIEKIKHLLFPDIFSNKLIFFFFNFESKKRNIFIFFLVIMKKRYCDYQGKLYVHEIANIFFLTRRENISKWLNELSLRLYNIHWTFFVLINSMNFSSWVLFRERTHLSF